MERDDITLLQKMHELQGQLAGKDALIESLKAEVICLRRWRFGASSESIDPSVAPELALVRIPAKPGQHSDAREAITPMDAGPVVKRSSGLWWLSVISSMPLGA